MRRLMFTIFVAICLLIGAGQMAPATWAQSPGEITGIQWQWAEPTETEPASQSVVPDPENYVLVLNADGSASIKADCNQVIWTYTLCKALWQGQPLAQVDVYRIQDGRIVEHWDNAEPVPPEEEWANSGKF